MKKEIERELLENLYYYNARKFIKFLMSMPKDYKETNKFTIDDMTEWSYIFETHIEFNLMMGLVIGMYKSKKEDKKVEREIRKLQKDIYDRVVKFFKEKFDLEVKF